MKKIIVSLFLLVGILTAANAQKFALVDMDW